MGGLNVQGIPYNISICCNITRTNLINWVVRYSRLGEAGLEDGRGKVNTGQFVIPPKIEGLPIKNKEENLRVKAENAYLRSLIELNINVIKKHTTK